MPRMPEVDDLRMVEGISPGVPRPVRDFVSPALQNFGQSVTAAGDRLYAQGEATRAEDDALDYARARSRFETARLEADAKYDTAVDPKYQGWTKAYDETASKMRDNIAAGIKNPKLAEKFKLETDPTLVGDRQRVNDRATKLDRDAKIAEFETGLTTRAGAAAIASDEESNRIIERVGADLGNLEASGAITPAQRIKMQDDFVRGVANVKMGYLVNDDPRKALEYLRGTPDAPQVAGDRGKQLAFVAHELNGTEGQAGRMLKSATTIEQATAAGISYERPQGWTPNYPAGGHGWKNRLNYARQVLAGKATPQAMQARAYFESIGYTPVQASGMVGNLMQESGPNLNPGAHGDKTIPGGSRGIGQWNRGRLAALRKFMGESGDVAMPSAEGLSSSEPVPDFVKILSPEDTLAFTKQAEVGANKLYEIEQANRVQQAADLTYDQFKDDAAKAYEFLRSIPDAEARQEAEKLYDARVAREKTIAEANTKAQRSELYDAITAPNATPEQSLQRIAASDIPPGDKEWLKKIAIEGTPQFDDRTTVDMLRRLQVSDEDAFLKADLMDHAGKLTSKTLLDFRKEQQTAEKARAGDTSKESKVYTEKRQAVSAAKPIVDSGLDQIGVDTSNKAKPQDARIAQQVRTIAGQRVEKLYDKLGRQPLESEIDAELKDMWKTIAVSRPGWLWGASTIDMELDDVLKAYDEGGYDYDEAVRSLTAAGHEVTYENLMIWKDGLDELKKKADK